jgi:hypothetical protein
MSIPFPPNTPLDAPEFFGDNQEFSRKRVRITYTADGRKIGDGILLKPYDPEQLWKELFTRELINQIHVKTNKEDP